VAAGHDHAARVPGATGSEGHRRRALPRSRLAWSRGKSKLWIYMPADAKPKSPMVDVVQRIPDES
jgi:hypothetical protein